MSYEPPVFSRDLMGSMALKGASPERSVFVSLELSGASHDTFWSDPEVLAALPTSSTIVRLVKGPDDAAFAQFEAVFHISFYPSLVFFGANSAAVTKVWEQYPAPSEFAHFFRPKPAPRRSPATASEPAPRRQKTTTKIRVRGRSGASIDREFQVSDTIGSLREWLHVELGEVRVIIGHTQQPLPDDDSMTLAEADLCPSAELKVIEGDVWEPEVNIEPPRAAQQTTTREPFRCSCCSCGRWGGRVARYTKFALSLVNPWFDATEEDEDGWEFRPNPELVTQIREQARMMNRMHYRG